MNSLSITFKNLSHRPLSTLLTMISVMIGSGLVIAVMTIQNETEKNFQQTTVPYNMILAAKGSPMQAYLNTMYHLETSTGIIPYDVYETAKQDPRVVHAFPFYVGDSYNGFRVVGTSFDFLSEGSPMVGRQFEFSEGRPFTSPFEAVLGWDVANDSGLGIGDSFYFSHGITEAHSSAEEHVHEDTPVTVTGILNRTGTAHDRVIYSSIETTHAAHDYSIQTPQQTRSGLPEHGDGHYHDSEPDASRSSLPGNEPHPDSLSYESLGIQVGELDAVLLRIGNDAAALQLAGMINYPTPENPMLRAGQMRDPFFQYKDQIMAVIPAAQMRNLMSIIGNVEQVIRIVAYLVLIVGLTGVLVSIFNTMDGRKRDIAVMRALGAGRRNVLILILLESGVIITAGCIFGFFAGHGIVALIAPVLADIAGIYVDSFQVSVEQIYILLLFVLAGTMLGLVPALKAWRTEATSHLVTS
jgi:putative ABC transport system permease protein